MYGSWGQELPCRVNNCWRSVRSSCSQTHHSCTRGARHSQPAGREGCMEDGRGDATVCFLRLSDDMGMG